MYVADYFGRCICSGDVLTSKVSRIHVYDFAVNIYVFSRFERGLLGTPLEVATSSTLPLSHEKLLPDVPLCGEVALSLDGTCSTSQLDVIDCWDVISYLFDVFIRLGSLRD